MDYLLIYEALFSFQKTPNIITALFVSQLSDQLHKFLLSCGTLLLLNLNPISNNLFRYTRLRDSAILGYHCQQTPKELVVPIANSKSFNRDHTRFR